MEGQRFVAGNKSTARTHGEYQSLHSPQRYLCFRCWKSRFSRLPADLKATVHARRPRPELDRRHRMSKIKPIARLSVVCEGKPGNLATTLPRHGGCVARQPSACRLMEDGGHERGVLALFNRVGPRFRGKENKTGDLWSVSCDWLLLRPWQSSPQDEFPRPMLQTTPGTYRPPAGPLTRVGILRPCRAQPTRRGSSTAGRPGLAPSSMQVAARSS